MALFNFPVKQLLLFTIVMAQLIFQIWVICQNGLLSYCAHLRNWLEVGWHSFKSFRFLAIISHICW